MSTRSIIVVTGRGIYQDKQVARLYKHSDGYPSANLPLIYRGIERATEIAIQAEKANPEKDAFTVEVIAGAIVCASLSEYGIGANIEEEFSGHLAPKMFGNQGDLEWIYVFDALDASLKIYGGGYTGNGPQEMVQKGVVDPESSAMRYIPEAQEGERKKVREWVKKLEELGVRINPGRHVKKKPKAAVASKPHISREQFYKYLDQIEKTGAGFWTRLSDGTITIFVRANRVNDPDQWANVHVIEKMFGIYVREVEPDPQSGHIMVRIKDPFWKKKNPDGIKWTRHVSTSTDEGVFQSETGLGSDGRYHARVYDRTTGKVWWMAEDSWKSQESARHHADQEFYRIVNRSQRKQYP